MKSASVNPKENGSSSNDKTVKITFARRHETNPDKTRGTYFAIMKPRNIGTNRVQNI